jgi:O-antigen/teichoic acid export membrane protein
MKSILIKTIKESGIYSLGPILRKMIGFFLIPLYTAYLTPSDYGNLEYIVTISGFFMIIASGGLETGFFKYGYGREMPERGKVLFNCIISSLMLIFIVFLAASIISPLLFNTPLLIKFFLIYLAGQCVFKQVSYILLVLRYTHRAKLYVTISTVNMLLVVALNVVLIVYYEMGFKGIVLSSAIASAIVLVSFGYLFKDEVRIKFDLSKIKKLFSFGLPMVPGNVAALIMTMSDRIFLVKYSTTAELGLYGYGYKFGMLINVLIITPFFLGWGPYKWDVYKMDAAKEIYSRFFGYLMAGLFIVVLIMSLSLSFLGHIMASNKEFAQGLVILPLILASYFFMGITNFQALGVLFKNRTYLISVAVAIAACMNIFLNFLLIPKYGMIGASIATVLSYFAHFVIYYKMNQFYYHVDYNKPQLVITTGLILIISFGLTAVFQLNGLKPFLFANLICLFIALPFYVVFYKKELRMTISYVKEFLRKRKFAVRM